MPKKTIYVRDEDQVLWEGAERVAELRESSVSMMVMEGLQMVIAQYEEAQELQNGLQRIDLEIDRLNGKVHEGAGIVFVGKKLAESGLGEGLFTKALGSVLTTAYLTRRNQLLFVVERTGPFYGGGVQSEAWLFETIQDAEQATDAKGEPLLDARCCARAARELGQTSRHVIELDI